MRVVHQWRFQTFHEPISINVCMVRFLLSVRCYLFLITDYRLLITFR